MRQAMQLINSLQNANTLACDTHVHVFDPARFEYARQRMFTPGPATVADLQGYLARMALTRVVLVQPSVYGSDHACLLDALRVLNAGGFEARGVAVINTSTADQEIARLDAAGVMGARINLAVNHAANAADRQLANAIRLFEQTETRLPAHWHFQWHTRLPVLHQLMPLIAASDRAHVLDHMGLPDLSAGIQTPEWQGLLTLLRASAGGRFYVKASAPYLVSGKTPAHADLHPWLRDLLDTRADRLLWGSNWPHTQGTARQWSLAARPQVGQHLERAIEPFRQVDERLWQNTCVAWAGEKATGLLGCNAQQLYGFAAVR
jgi:2-pyrone-4,6-dicarboxylate lactonase